MPSIMETNGVVRLMMVKIMVPMILNIRWMMVVRLALGRVPMDASTAVIQVPMFCPNRMNTALDRGIIPVEARACRIPTEAEEDWIRAVKMAPMAIPISGFLKVVIKLMKVAESWRGAMASPIISIPMNSTPSPAKMELICRTFSFLTNMIQATPRKAMRGAMAPMSRAIS